MRRSPPLALVALPVCSEPGDYTVAVQELISANGIPFDSANASPVTTTIPALITVHVLPEKLEFLQQPPGTVVSGQTFSASAAIEDLAGNIITDVGSTSDLQFFAVLTAVGVKGNPITLDNNVPFVGGEATFSNLSIVPEGAYRLHVTVFSTNADGGVIGPMDLMGQSKFLTISTLGS